ncbi:MAG: sugar transferase [Verrucomicrobia bacterium]|nr:sugar transferase [Verrucomicrobiota bacterium]
MKRCFDLTITILGMPLWLPLLLLIALLVRVTLGPPIFFRQKRPGLHCEIFEILKFRTMTNARSSSGDPLPDADRFTSWGHWLRTTSLDELPELINLLRGDMSLVGPRPLLVQYLERYTPEQARRHEVRPGITGWAQIKGRNSISWEEKLRLDLWYVDNHSLWLDLKILALTVAMVLSRQGINAPGEATMPEFLGTSVENRKEQQLQTHDQPVLPARTNARE